MTRDINNNNNNNNMSDDFGTSCQLDSKVGLDPLKKPFGISIKYMALN
jgi:hypothetical protein